MALPRLDKYTITLYQGGQVQESITTFNFREARATWARYDKTACYGSGAVELKINDQYIPYARAYKILITEEIRKKRWSAGPY